jgi:RimJ/RimL family protein N-acetyltransferase
MLSFRKATQADMMLYLEWANDEDVRKQSYQTGTISLEDHTEWFLKKINDSNCLMLLFENEAKVPVGQVRFQKENEKVYVIGISLAKEFRGKGLAGAILVMASDHFFEIFPENSIYAYIKISNIESLRSFAKAGFVFANNVMIKNSESVLYIKYKENEDS